MKEVAGITFTQTIKLRFAGSWAVLPGKSAWHRHTGENYTVRAAGMLASMIPARGGEVRMAEYIERRKAAEILCKAICGAERGLCVSTPENCCQEKILALYELPADDVAHAVHGKWILKETVHIGLKEYMCSECSDDEYWKKYYCRGNEKFCPNCGAKMDLSTDISTET